MEKIRYRLVYNYSNYKTKSGLASVSLECRQGNKKFYISSNVRIYPNQWEGRRVVNHPNQDKLTVHLNKWKAQIEEIELDSILNGKPMSLSQLHDAIKHNARSSATLREFTEGTILSAEDRKESTKVNYRSLLNEIEKMYGDKLTLDDITNEFVNKFRADMRKKGLSENTIKGRLKHLKAIISEAMTRKLIKDNPFVGITIGNMTARTTFLTFDEVAALESLQLKGKEKHIRDAFVWCCCTGLRFNDFRSIRDEDIVNDVLRITQHKTDGAVSIPLKHLFGGKALTILSRYPSVKAFANIGDNGNANRILKVLAKKAGITKNVSFHVARHTAGTLLNQAGLKMQEIQKILGHSTMQVTASTYAVTTAEQLDNSLKRLSKNKVWEE